MLYIFKSYIRILLNTKITNVLSVLKFSDLLIYSWPCWVSVAACGLSPAVGGRGCSQLWCMGFSSRRLLLLGTTGSRSPGLRQLWPEGSRAEAQLWPPWHVEPSWSRDQTCIPWIGRQILYPGTPREVCKYIFLHCLLIYCYLSHLSIIYLELIFVYAMIKTKCLF